MCLNIFFYIEIYNNSIEYLILSIHEQSKNIFLNMNRKTGDLLIYFIFRGFNNYLLFTTKLLIR